MWAAVVLLWWSGSAEASLEEDESFRLFANQSTCEQKCVHICEEVPPGAWECTLFKWELALIIFACALLLLGAVVCCIIWGRRFLVRRQEGNAGFFQRRRGPGTPGSALESKSISIHVPPGSISGGHTTTSLPTSIRKSKTPSSVMPTASPSAARLVTQDRVTPRRSVGPSGRRDSWTVLSTDDATNNPPRRKRKAALTAEEESGKAEPSARTQLVSGVESESSLITNETPPGGEPNSGEGNEHDSHDTSNEVPSPSHQSHILSIPHSP